MGMRWKKTSFWGVLLIFLAVMLILKEINVINDVRIWGTILSAFFIAVFINGIRKLSLFRIFFSAAFLLIIWKSEITGFHMKNSTILLIAFLLFLGCNMLFGKSLMRFRTKRAIKKATSGFSDDVRSRIDAGMNGDFETAFRDGFSAMEGEEDFSEDAVCNNSFGALEKRIKSPNLKSVAIVNKFGGSEIYLHESKPASNKILITVDIKCGGVELYIPREWNVENHIVCSGGNIEINSRSSNVTEATVELVGKIVAGSLEINMI